MLRHHFLLASLLCLFPIMLPRHLVSSLPSTRSAFLRWAPTPSQAPDGLLPVSSLPSPPLPSISEGLVLPVPPIRSIYSDEFKSDRDAAFLHSPSSCSDMSSFDGSSPDSALSASTVAILREFLNLDSSIIRRVYGFCSPLSCDCDLRRALDLWYDLVCVEANPGPPKKFRLSPLKR